MNKRIERIGKIKNFLRFQSGAVTVSEIHEALVKRLSLDISRKTIERDIINMVEDGLVSLSPGMPMRYQLIKPAEVDLALKVEEITLILELLEQDSELHQKLKRALV
jgi:DeoR/GlpR family transcriptional regulator of sugar metabolism